MLCVLFCVVLYCIVLCLFLFWSRATGDVDITDFDIDSKLTPYHFSPVKSYLRFSYKPLTWDNVHNEQIFVICVQYGGKTV